MLNILICDLKKKLHLSIQQYNVRFEDKWVQGKSTASYLCADLEHAFACAATVYAQSPECAFVTLNLSLADHVTRIVTILRLISLHNISVSDLIQVSAPQKISISVELQSVKVSESHCSCTSDFTPFYMYRGIGCPSIYKHSKVNARNRDRTTSWPGPVAPSTQICPR